MGLAAAWLLFIGTAIQAVLAVRDVVVDIGGGSAFVKLRGEYTRAEDTYIRDFRAAASMDEIDRAEKTYKTAVRLNSAEWKETEKRARSRATSWMIGWLVLVLGALANLFATYANGVTM